MRYKAQWDYASSYAAFNEGDVVDLEDELAEAINRDSPGVLAPVKARGADQPPADRMVKKPRRSAKGQPGDGSGGPITRAEHGAVKDPAKD